MKNAHRKALELIRNDNWDGAHRLIQDYSDALSCRIHGYLHRIEGDMDNARYWYQRAGLEFPNNTPAQELKDLIAILAESSQ